MRPMLVLFVLLTLPYPILMDFLFTPSLAGAQGFGSGFLDGLKQGSQYGLARQQLALQQQQLKLQQLEHWRALRQQELEGEVTQWAFTVQQWRDATGQPRWTQEELFAALDRLRVLDWERQYEQAWLQQ
ncbi:MAG: hypothetical protein SGJ16_11910 [Nitrospirota bacterium]|nr:hypothetical protein [Nitrospirota bacterium]